MIRIINRIMILNNNKAEAIQMEERPKTSEGAAAVTAPPPTPMFFPVSPNLFKSGGNPSLMTVTKFADFFDTPPGFHLTHKLGSRWMESLFISGLQSINLTIRNPDPSHQL